MCVHDLGDIKRENKVSEYYYRLDYTSRYCDDIATHDGSMYLS